MDETKPRQRTTMWIILAAIIGLLLGCGAGTLAGGLAGYAAGRISAPQPLQPMPPYRPFPPVPPLDEPEEPPVGYDLDGARVALVIDVQPNSPAEAAGLERGDMILAMDVMPLSEWDDLAARMSLYEPGDVVVLSILRDGQPMDLEVVLGRHPERSGDAPWLGIEYRMMPSIQPLMAPRRPSE